MSLEARINEKLSTYDAISADPEVDAICTWMQPNTSEVFDDEGFDHSFEASLNAFFALDEAAASLIRAKSA